MKVGVVGLGKLGLPVAVAINSKRHEVFGYDISQDPGTYLDDRKIPYKEADLQPLLDEHTVQVVDSVEKVVENSDIIFLPVQTPHSPEFEGSTRTPKERRDFDYKYLETAVADVSAAAKRQRKEVKLVVISTCLPGTYNKRIFPIISNNPFIRYFYNPFFIAMGTVIKDFLNPEFVLIGAHSSTRELKDFYLTLHKKPVFETDITTAEGIKVFYNTFITAKTVLANVYGEMAHKMGMNVDDIYGALSMATDRIVSPKYLQAGLGDGGGCHPRDNIALSWLAKEVNMSHNVFEDLMAAREDHSEWLAALTVEEAAKKNLPIVILGRAFKPETNIETGSPAILIANMVKEYGFEAEHVEDIEPYKAVYLLGCKHDRYKDYDFPKGSVVIDPFRYLEKTEGITYIPIGRPHAIMNANMG